MFLFIFVWVFVYMIVFVCVCLLVCVYTCSFVCVTMQCPHVAPICGLLTAGVMYWFHCYMIIRTVTRSSQIVIQNLAFAAEGSHSLLWPEATTFERSQRAYLWPEAATVRCGHRPQHLERHKSVIFWSPSAACFIASR